MVIDGIEMKGKKSIMSGFPQRRSLDQFHLNNMGVKKTGLLLCESMYWKNYNANLENTIENPHMSQLSGDTTK